MAKKLFTQRPWIKPIDLVDAQIGFEITAIDEIENSYLGQESKNWLYRITTEHGDDYKFSLARNSNRDDVTQPLVEALEEGEELPMCWLIGEGKGYAFTLLDPKMPKALKGSKDKRAIAVGKEEEAKRKAREEAELAADMDEIPF